MDPFWIAIVSASSAVAGAFVGALPGLIESTAKRRESEKSREAEADQVRYGKGIDFIDAMTGFVGSMWHDTVQLNRAASAFISTLRPGEGRVATYVRGAVESLMAAEKGKQRLAIANSTADEVFRFLRGDVAPNDIGKLR